VDITTELVRPTQPTVEEIPNPFIKRPDVKVYEGNVNKMGVFNEGENGQDRAVTFQLKMGVQENTFALAIDPKNGQRIINLEDSSKVQEMTPDELRTVALLQKQGNNLILSRTDKDLEISQDSLREKPYVIQISDNLGVEILDFDPEQNSLTIHKTTLDRLSPDAFIAPLPVSEGTSQSAPTGSEKLRKKILEIMGIPPIVGASLIPGQTATNETPPPPPIVETIPADKIPENSLLYETHESLTCPATKEMKIKQGDFLTKLLVDTNGMKRYLKPDGTMDVKLLYRDLACLLAIPENQQALESSDPTVANFVKSVMNPDNQLIFGQTTADKLLEGFFILNSPNGQERYPGASKQLMIVHEGQVFLVPYFTDGAQSSFSNPPTESLQ